MVGAVLTGVNAKYTLFKIYTFQSCHRPLVSGTDAFLRACPCGPDSGDGEGQAVSAA